MGRTLRNTPYRWEYVELPHAGKADKYRLAVRAWTYGEALNGIKASLPSRRLDRMINNPERWTLKRIEGDEVWLVKPKS